jgi:hypothetical protein
MPSGAAEEVTPYYRVPGKDWPRVTEPTFIPYISPTPRIKVDRIKTLSVSDSDETDTYLRGGEDFLTRISCVLFAANNKTN